MNEYLYHRQKGLAIQVTTPKKSRCSEDADCVLGAGHTSTCVNRYGVDLPGRPPRSLIESDPIIPGWSLGHE